MLINYSAKLFLEKLNDGVGINELFGIDDIIDVIKYHTDKNTFNSMLHNNGFRTIRPMISNEYVLALFVTNQSDCKTVLRCNVDLRIFKKDDTKNNNNFMVTHTISGFVDGDWQGDKFAKQNYYKNFINSLSEKRIQIALKEIINMFIKLTIFNSKYGKN